MGQSTREVAPNATINSFRMQRIAMREGSARNKDDKDI